MLACVHTDINIIIIMYIHTYMSRQMRERGGGGGERERERQKERQRKRLRERENSNTLILKDSSVTRSIWPSLKSQSLLLERERVGTQREREDRERNVDI